MPTALEFAGSLERVAHDEVNPTKVGTNSWAMDFRLPVAPDAPFKSSLEYDADEQQITGAAIRFSPSLLERYDDDTLREKMDQLLESSNPPPGGLWHTYIRGDAPVTGPHIGTPGGFSAVDVHEFVPWVRRLLTVYDEVFAMSADGSTGKATADRTEAANQTLDVFDDGSVRFVPPHSKADADYREPEDDDFDPDHDRCGDCVHFIPGEGCHFVQGGIRATAYCDEYYADYGAFAHAHDDGMHINAELYSDAWTVEERDIDDLLDALEGHLNQQRHKQEREADDSDSESSDDDGGWFSY